MGEYADMSMDQGEWGDAIRITNKMAARYNAKQSANTDKWHDDLRLSVWRMMLWSLQK